MEDQPHITHVALFVADVEATRRFYEQFVGLHLVHDRVDDGVRVIWLSETKDDPRFVIVAIGIPPDAAPATRPLVAHLGYDLPSRQAVDRVAARAEPAGILTHPPSYAGPVVGYFCILRDPDGNLVEFSHGQAINPHTATPNHKPIPERAS